MDDEQHTEPMPEVADQSAAARLRAFEDEVLPGAPRINGELERGHGSLFQRMTKEQHKQHHDLEKLAVAEAHLAKARAGLVAAEVAYAAALAVVDGQSDAAKPVSGIE